MNKDELNEYNLTKIAKKAMVEKDMLPEFSPDVMRELSTINKPAPCPISEKAVDLRLKPFFSIDNDDSRDLDQLTYAEEKDNGETKIFVAVADVDALVKDGSFVNGHAEHNTTSVYTPTKIFTMLPEKLSTNLTSLNENESRQAIVVEMDIDANGETKHYSIYQACVKNHAKLAYNSVGNWLETRTSPPAAVKGNKVFADQLILHDKIAQKMKANRQSRGMLSFETIEVRAVVSNEIVVDFVEIHKNRARDIIENFMIAANNAVTRFLQGHQFPTFRRIVRVPQRWARIVDLAHERGFKLPANPNPLALEEFLNLQKSKDPARFPDLSLAIIKLIGRGEYTLQLPDEKPIGHFGLALRHYSHSTAPNRRFPDLITHRLLKAALDNKKLPYSLERLTQLAAHCTAKEADADKVTRRVLKSAAAMILSNQINNTFDAFVTGGGPKGTWVRIFHPPTEGKLVRGYEKVDVGDRIKVKLVSVDIPNGFIDFVRVK